VKTGHPDAGHRRLVDNQEGRVMSAATIAGAGLAGGEQAAALAVFVLIGSIGVLAPLIVYLVDGRAVPGLQLEARR
jgi:hypothetical protein